MTGNNAKLRGGGEELLRVDGVDVGGAGPVRTQLQVEDGGRVRVGREVGEQGGDERGLAAVEGVEELEGVVTETFGPEEMEERGAVLLIVKDEGGTEKEGVGEEEDGGQQVGEEQWMRGRGHDEE